MPLDDAAHRAATISESQLRASGPLVFSTMFDYDFATSGDPASSTNISSQIVPAGAQIIGGWYKILTTFTSAASTATLAISLVGANDLVTAIAINDASAPWTIDLTKDRPLKSIATVLSANQRVKIISGVQAVTAGKLIGVVNWILPENLSSGH